VGLALLAVGGFTAYLAGNYVWAACHLRAARQALEQERFVQARSSLKLCLEVWPHSPEIHLLVAQAARRAGAYEEARRHLHLCAEFNGSDEAVALERALLYAQEGRVDLAEGDLLPLVRREDPRTPLILEALIEGYLQSGHVAQTRECLEKLLELRPRSVRARMWRAELLEGLFSVPHATEEYRNVLELDPDHKEARLRLAEILIEGGKSEEAMEHFNRLRRESPGDPRVILGQARCLNDLGQYEQAGSLLDLLLGVRPDDSLALTERGRVALRTEHLEQAEVFLRKALAAAPYERYANFLLFECLQRQGRAEEAAHCRRRMEDIEAGLHRLRALTRQMARAPGDLALRCEAGQLLLNHGREKYGLGWLESVLREDPGHGPAHEALADYYERAGQAALAHRHRQLALRCRANAAPAPR
jgi:tetratricopeptide (TPR) repeat protein